MVRRAEPGDYEAFAKIFAQPSAYSGTLQAPFPSVEGWRKRLAEPVDGDFIFAAEVNGEVVGNAGLHHHKSPRRAHSMDIGMAVRDDFQGKGVGTALMKALVELADGWLNVSRLELTVYTDNHRAIALYEKFGFVREGTHRAYALRDGHYIDAHCMARVKGKPAA